MPRTNNHVEGFHNALRKSITQTHPTIWKLIVGLKKEETLAVTKIVQWERDGEPNKVRKTTENLKRLITTYNSEDKLKFLRGVAHNLKVF